MRQSLYYTCYYTAVIAMIWLLQLDKDDNGTNTAASVLSEWDDLKAYVHRDSWK